MAIAYPVDVANTRWAVIQISTGEIVSRNQIWPRADGEAIDGQDPDYAHLLHVNNTAPQYDSRLFALETNEEVDLPNNELRKSYNTLARPIEERKVAAANVETEEAQKHFNFEDEFVEMRLALTVLMEMADGTAVPPRVRAFFNEFKRRGRKLLRNRDRRRAIDTDLENQIEPDLDSGWEPKD